MTLALKPGSPTDRPATDYGLRRTCDACGTRLSRYNPGPNCYAHEERTMVLSGGPRLRHNRCYPAQGVHIPNCSHGRPA